LGLSIGQHHPSGDKSKPEAAPGFFLGG